MVKKVLLTFKDAGKNQAGPKATQDVEKILVNHGFESETFYLNLDSKIKKLYYAKYYFSRMFRKRGIDELVVQYPIYSRYIVKAIITNFRKYSNGKIYFVIHDLEGLRLYKDDETYSQDELDFFRLIDGVIAHNPSMKKYLESKGIKGKITCVNFFDYLVKEDSSDFNVENISKNRICFAGNLAKASFLDKLSLSDIKLDVYGVNRSTSYNNGIEYKGVFPPDQLPLMLHEKFGLVWDGNSIKKCGGTYGNYIKYNSPHKASLYLSAGIPIIVWNQSAISELVEEYGLGISVNSLENIDQVVLGIPESTYLELKNNAVRYSNKIRSGQNIIKAIKSLEERV